MPDTQKTPLFAPSLVQKHVRCVLDLEERMMHERPLSIVKALPLVLRVYEIAANAYRQGGVSPGQFKALEAAVAKLEDLLR